MDNGENIHVISEQEDRALAAIVRSVPDIIYRLDEQGVLQKPFTADELMDLVHQMLDD